MTMTDPGKIMAALLGLGWRVDSVGPGVARLAWHTMSDLLLVPTDPNAPEYTPLLAELHRQLTICQRHGQAAYQALCALNDKGRGAAPFGMRHTDDGLVPDEREQATLNRMRELHKSGMGLRAMCITLTAEGHRPRRAQRWYPQVIREIVSRFE